MPESWSMGQKTSLVSNEKLEQDTSCCPLTWKFFENSKKANSVFRTSASCSKILNDKKYIFNTVNSGHTLFFRASASCSKIPNAKIFNTMKNFRGTLFFGASASCSKFLNDKKYIFNTENSGHTLFFKASTCCSKILNVKIFNTVKKSVQLYF